MTYTKIDPINYPIKKGESWWICHPNNPNCEFKVPQGGVTLCINSLFDFTAGRIYEISDNDSDNGWITVACKETVVKMPYYVFARYFDTECFVKNNSHSRICRNKNIERFEDKGDE